MDTRYPSTVVVGGISISTKLDLLNDKSDFVIYESDPDFAATGLEVSSDVLGLPVATVIPLEKLGRCIGRLTGELLDDFQRWAGHS